MSFVTMKNYMGSFSKNGGLVPTRIDKTSMLGLANAVTSALLGALRYFNLIDEKGVPQPDFYILATGTDAERTAVWRKMFESGYSDIIAGLNLERASLGELRERFDKIGLEVDNTRKCYGFFVGLAEAAEVPMAAHLKPVRGGKPGARRPRRPKNGRTSTEPELPLTPPAAPPAQAPPQSVTEILLSKFPAFDPSWSADIQEKWFAGFQTLMTKAEK